MQFKEAKERLLKTFAEYCTQGTLAVFKILLGDGWAPEARFRRRSTYVPNLTDELSTAKERRLNQFGTAAVLVWCGKSVKFDRVRVELLSNLT